MDITHKWVKKIIACVSLLLIFFLPISPLAYAEELSESASPATISPINTESTAPLIVSPSPDSAPSAEVPTTLKIEAPKEVTVPEKESGLEVTPLDPGVQADHTEDESRLNEEDDSRKDNCEETDVEEIINNNSSETVNDVDVEGDSGNNKANENDGDVLLNSGDVDIILSIMNLINSTLISQSPDGIQFVVKNLNGYNGDIIIDPKTGNITSLKGGPVILGNINNINKGELTNDINLNGNTGNNEANKNDGNTSINSGNLNFSVNLINFLNSTFIVGDFGSVNIMNIFGNLNGNIVVPELANTESQNNQTVLDKFKSLFNDNFTNLINEINGNMNTGNNLANENDGDTTIATGSVNELLNLSNFVSINLIGDTVYMAIINVLGKFNGQKLLSPLVAFFTDGKLSLAGNENAANDLSVTKNNSGGLLKNIVNLFGNTGGNSANENDGNVSIMTGDISIITNILNFSNLNIIANKFVFMVVNVFGDWNGKLALFGVDKKEDEKPPFNGTETAVSEVITNRINFNQRLPLTSFAIAGNDITGEAAVKSQSTYPSVFENPFELEKKETNTMAAFVLDNLNQIIFYAFLTYLLAIAAYFAIRVSRIYK